ncbi:MAG: helix-turn-helix transcriptional regulator [Planctomycetes bacterium]|nr:helix-turn-helix transcriptional regulator [Planctomycetota bacterium]
MAPFKQFLKNLGQHVRELRRARGWSQEELAHAAGLSRTYMGTVELGMKQPSLRTLFRIAEALNVSMAEIFLPPAALRPSSRDIIARIEAMLADPHRTMPELRKAEDLVNAFFRKS